MIHAAFVCLLLLGPVEVPPGEISPREPQDTANTLRLPQGFSATLFAGEPDLVQPISFAIDDRGRLWVAENLSYPNWSPQGKDRIVMFEDVDGDGRFDTQKLFYDRLNYVTGVEVGFGGVWIVSPPSLIFIPDRDGDCEPDGPAEILLDGFGHQGVHNLANGFTWGPDGWLYGGHGGSSFSRLGKPESPDSERVDFDGGVWRYHPTLHIFEGFAEGTTNPWGVDFNDEGQAFISNCVTPHLYHVIQGAHYQRRRDSPLSVHAYGRIDTIADHLHWVGSDWAKSRGGTPEQIAAGGGHAHAGAMIYLGDSFPDTFRGSMFMCNIHGSRINSDILVRRGSGYVGRHGPDLATASDPWFRGLGLQTGPDGSVFVSDWYDTGECHSRHPDRTNGRIYKIVYRDTERVTNLDLSRLDDRELVELQLAKNDWYVRHARRLLQERATAGRLTRETRAGLLKILNEHPDVTRKLRALWALHVTGGLDLESRLELLGNAHHYIRAWVIQLELEDRRVSGPFLDKLGELAVEDPSPLVRLYLAAALQRLPLEQRWGIAEALIVHDEDAFDHNLPCMVWYGIEPLVAADPERAAALLLNARIPLVREFIARRLASLAP